MSGFAPPPRPIPMAEDTQRHVQPVGDALVARAVHEERLRIAAEIDDCLLRPVWGTFTDRINAMHALARRLRRVD